MSGAARRFTRRDQVRAAAGSTQRRGLRPDARDDWRGPRSTEAAGSDLKSVVEVIDAPERRTILVKEALLVEWLTVAWMLIEAGVAIGSGVAARSLTLLAFGVDSVIELLSAL